MYDLGVFLSSDFSFPGHAMAELCPISQNVEEIAKKLRISDSDSGDPTSRLPDHVLHSILSYLKSEQLFHARLVSKNWHRNTPSYFPLEFDESIFFEKTPTTPAAVIQESHNKFLEWIRSSLETSQPELIKAEKRVIRVQFKHHENINDIMKLINGIDFHEVYLRFGCINYSIPFIFQSKCLTVVHLIRCGIHKLLFSDEANFSNLEEVELDNVHLTGETLSIFISKCPNIRELKLVNCKALRSVLLPKVDRLKKLCVQLVGSYPSITDVQVIAPSLQVFHFVHYNSSNLAVNMDIRACKMLREFHLECPTFPVGFDHEHFISDFPYLETLIIGPCETSKRVKISSPSLRKLTLMFTQLYNYNYSRKSVVSVPNLCSFQYVGRTFKSSLAPSGTPKFLKTTGISLVPHVEKINRAWFLQLRSHLTKLSNRIGLALIIRAQTSFSELGKQGHRLWSIPIGRIPTQVIPHIELLKLDIRLNVPQESHGCLLKYIIDNLLWMSHPNALTLSMPTSFAAFALGICNEFLISRRDGNCCADTRNKCWRHFLKDFMVREAVTNEKEELKKFSFVFTWQL
ncbi:uncharacterized protein LOC107012592 [Solanum pennellii]|uniref:Uncharacterized protein LOC107012592 n=1 Tax=Solanum pennellii TaxID=28526 RepID=A0ABM1G9T3_SOLPN|nr:uncharacterized protein LOC107012592 [Solanum pennellii]